MSVFKGDELGTADACDGLDTGRASFGEQFTVAVGTVGLLILGGEPLAGQRAVAIRAAETFPVPWLVFVRNSAGADHLLALAASGGELLLVAAGAKDLLILGDETPSADRRLAVGAHEALVVPLLSLVFHLLHSCFENFPASVASGGECLIVAVGAVDPVIFAAEWFVHK